MGLFLTGGGARGAYQAGVLNGISQFLPEDKNPFPILTGTSAGAINCSFIASKIEHENFKQITSDLVYLWENIKSNDVLQTNPIKLFGNGSKWLSILMGGGLHIGNTRNLSLLNTDNLITFLSKHISFKNISEAVKNKHLDSIGITTLCYEDSKTRTFFDTSLDIEPWQRNLREGIRESINLNHIISSASIPIIFPSHKYSTKFYGDGSIRNIAPLSASIKLGADKILIINVKAKRSPMIIDEKGPSLSQVLGTLLHGLMLDNLDSDIERVEGINNLLNGQEDPAGHRQVKTLLISPSENIGKIASQEYQNLPKTIQFLFKGLGDPKESSDLISYLLFEKSFTSRLIRLGYQDALNNKEKILNFLKD